VSARIPDKLYFKIGEVAEIAGVEPYVLRFWESEFPILSPRKAESGHRVYRRKDVETVISSPKPLTRNADAFRPLPMGEVDSVSTIECRAWQHLTKMT
jgi:hypothetical protein